MLVIYCTHGDLSRGIPKIEGNTPTKPVKGGKAKEESVDDFCRLCGVNFKVKFGNFQKSTRYISTENFLDLLAARSEKAKH